MRAKFLTLILLFSTVAYADSNTLTKNWNKLIISCPNSITKLSAELDEYNRTESQKLNSYTIDKFNKIFENKKSETEIIKVLFPYMIPNQVAFDGIDKACWPYLNDFYSELKNNKIKQAQSSIKAWEGCLIFNYKKTPKTAQQLIQCFKKAVKKQ